MSNINIFINKKSMALSHALQHIICIKYFKTYQ